MRRPGDHRAPGKHAASNDASSNDAVPNDAAPDDRCADYHAAPDHDTTPSNVSTGIYIQPRDASVRSRNQNFHDAASDHDPRSVSLGTGA